MRRYWIYRMVETAPWEQKPDVIALESLQKVVPEALTEKAAKRTVGKNQIRRKCAYNRWELYLKDMTTRVCAASLQSLWEVYVSHGLL